MGVLSLINKSRWVLGVGALTCATGCVARWEHRKGETKITALACGLLTGTLGVYLLKDGIWIAKTLHRSWRWKSLRQFVKGYQWIAFNVGVTIPALKFSYNVTRGLIRKEDDAITRQFFAGRFNYKGLLFNVTEVDEAQVQYAADDMLLFKQLVPKMTPSQIERVIRLGGQRHIGAMVSTLKGCELQGEFHRLLAKVVNTCATIEKRENLNDRIANLESTSEGGANARHEKTRLALLKETQEIVSAVSWVTSFLDAAPWLKEGSQEIDDLLGEGWRSEPQKALGKLPQNLRLIIRDVTRHRMNLNALKSKFGTVEAASYSDPATDIYTAAQGRLQDVASGLKLTNISELPAWLEEMGLKTEEDTRAVLPQDKTTWNLDTICVALRAHRRRWLESRPKGFAQMVQTLLSTSTTYKGVIYKIASDALYVASWSAGRVVAIGQAPISFAVGMGCGLGERARNKWKAMSGREIMDWATRLRSQNDDGRVFMLALPLLVEVAQNHLLDLGGFSLFQRCRAFQKRSLDAQARTLATEVGIESLYEGTSSFMSWVLGWNSDQMWAQGVPLNQLGGMWRNVAMGRSFFHSVWDTIADGIRLWKGDHL